MRLTLLVSHPLLDFSPCEGIEIISRREGDLTVLIRLPFQQPNQFVVPNYLQLEHFDDIQAPCIGGHITEDLEPAPFASPVGFVKQVIVSLRASPASFRFGQLLLDTRENAGLCRLRQHIQPEHEPFCPRFHSRLSFSHLDFTPTSLLQVAGCKLKVLLVQGALGVVFDSSLFTHYSSLITSPNIQTAIPPGLRFAV